MLFPSKFVTFEESSIFNSMKLVTNIPKNGITIQDLYKLSDNAEKSLDDFISSLTILYGLNIIEYNDITGVIKNVI